MLLEFENIIDLCGSQSDEPEGEQPKDDEEKKPEQVEHCYRPSEVGQSRFGVRGSGGGGISASALRRRRGDHNGGRLCVAEGAAVMGGCVGGDVAALSLKNGTRRALRKQLVRTKPTTTSLLA
jgi:hypothetical protein